MLLLALALQLPPQPKGAPIRHCLMSNQGAMGWAVVVWEERDGLNTTDPKEPSKGFNSVSYANHPKKPHTMKEAVKECQKYLDDPEPNKRKTK